MGKRREEKAEYGSDSTLGCLGNVNCGGKDCRLFASHHTKEQRDQQTVMTAVGTMNSFI
jgi:hypothetical protein